MYVILFLWVRRGKILISVWGVVVMEEFGSRLKQLRLRRGWTQKQLAAQIHKSTATIGSYEQNIQIPPVDVLIVLSSLFHVGIDELLGIDTGNADLQKGLTDLQRKTLEMIIDEFINPTNTASQGLTNAQIEIINNLIRIFTCP